MPTVRLAQRDLTKVLDDFIQHCFSVQFCLKGVLFLWLCNLKRQVAEQSFAHGRPYSSTFLSRQLSTFCWIEKTDLEKHNCTKPQRIPHYTLCWDECWEGKTKNIVKRLQQGRLFVWFHSWNLARRMYLWRCHHRLRTKVFLGNWGYCWMNFKLLALGTHLVFSVIVQSVLRHFWTWFRAVHTKVKVKFP